MGAFGTGTFENDDALDFLEELVVSDGAGLVIGAFEEALGADYLEMPEASAALVAAEALAAKNLRPAADLPEDLAIWAQKAGFALTESLLATAQKAVARVATGSELNDEWSESDLSEQWQASLSDLQDRLDAG